MAGVEDFLSLFSTAGEQFPGQLLEDVSAAPQSFSFPSVPSFGDVGSALKTGATELGGLAKSVLPIAQLGAGVGQLVLGSQAGGQLARQTKLAEQAGRRQEQIAGQAQTVAQPIAAFGQEELTKAGAGQIPTAIQAQIDLWLQGAKQKVQDYAARSGQGDSAQLVSWMNWLDQQAEAMKASALEREQALGIQAGGTAGGVLGAAAGAAGGAGNIAAGQQVGIEQLIASANEQLAKLSAGAS